MDKIWYLPQPRRLSWRVWDGEVVVYNDATGNTHELGPLASEVFDALLIGPICRTDLTQRVSQALNIEDTVELSEAVKNTIEQFYSVGLIESLENR